jgi:hypothetical protein
MYPFSNGREQKVISVGLYSLGEGVDGERYMSTWEPPPQLKFPKGIGNRLVSVTNSTPFYFSHSAPLIINPICYGLQTKN